MTLVLNEEQQQEIDLVAFHKDCTWRDEKDHLKDSSIPSFELSPLRPVKIPGKLTLTSCNTNPLVTIKESFK